MGRVVPYQQGDIASSATPAVAVPDVGLTQARSAAQRANALSDAAITSQRYDASRQAQLGRTAAGVLANVGETLGDTLRAKQHKLEQYATHQRELETKVNVKKHSTDLELGVIADAEEARQLFASDPKAAEAWLKDKTAKRYEDYFAQNNLGQDPDVAAGVAYNFLENQSTQLAGVKKWSIEAGKDNAKVGMDSTLERLRMVPGNINGDIRKFTDNLRATYNLYPELAVLHGENKAKAMIQDEQTKQTEKLFDWYSVFRPADVALLLDSGKYDALMPDTKKREQYKDDADKRMKANEVKALDLIKKQRKNEEMKYEVEYYKGLNATDAGVVQLGIRTLRNEYNRIVAMPADTPEMVDYKEYMIKEVGGKVHSLTEKLETMNNRAKMLAAQQSQAASLAAIAKQKATLASDTAVQAREYAGSLFNLAPKGDTVTGTVDELEAVSKALKEYNGLVANGYAGLPNKVNKDVEGRVARLQALWKTITAQMRTNEAEAKKAEAEALKAEGFNLEGFGIKSTNEEVVAAREELAAAQKELKYFEAVTGDPPPQVKTLIKQSKDNARLNDQLTSFYGVEMLAGAAEFERRLGRKPTQAEIKKYIQPLVETATVSRFGRQQ